MVQSNIDFINTASKLIPVFDGKAENLTSFIDALEITELIKGEHEQIAVSIIKTKIRGVARNLKNYPQRSGNRGRGNYIGNFRGRNYNYNNNSTQNNTGRGQYRGNYRGRGNSSRGHNNNNQNNVLVTNSQTNSTSGNSQNPLDIQQ